MIMKSREAERAWLDQLATLLQQPVVEDAALQRLRQAVLAELAARPRPYLRLLSREPGGLHEPSRRAPHPSEREEPRAAPRARWWVPLGLGLAGALGVATWYAAWQEPAESPPRTADGAGTLAAPVADGTPGGTEENSGDRAAPTSLSRAELFLAAGEVWVEDRSPALQLVSLGERVTTGAGTACLTLDPEIEVCLAEHTRATLSRLERHAIEVRVEEGTAVARLSPRSAGHEFTLAAAGVRATAKGTVYSITHRGSHATASDGEHPVEVTVLEGSVQVTEEKNGAPAIARAHTRVRSGGTTASSSEPVGRQSEGALWRLLGSEQWLRERQVGTLSVEADGAGDANDLVLLDDEGPYRLPLHVVLPAGPHRLRRPGQSSEQVVEIVAGQRTALTELEGSRARAGSPITESAPATASPGARGASPPSVQRTAAQRTAAQHLASAREHLHRGERRAALEAYRRLLAEHPASPEAHTVAVTVAQLELELGSAARALRGFERYLASPGALAPEALAGKVAALTALGRSSEARNAARAYLERYPKGTHAESMRRLSQPRSER